MCRSDRRKTPLCVAMKENNKGGGGGMDMGRKKERKKQVRGKDKTRPRRGRSAHRCVCVVLDRALMKEEGGKNTKNRG